MEVHVDNLEFRVRGGFVLGPVTMHLRPGEVTALLGPNGAGKTTLMRVLTGLLFGTSGSIRLDGRLADPHELRRTVGYTPTEPRFPPRATVSDLLQLRLGGMEKTTGAALAERLGRPLRTYPARLSRGQRMLVALELTLAGDPPVLLVDEPWSGLDPLAQEEVLERLETHRQRAAILVSSHDLLHLPQVAQRFVFLHRGRVHAEGTLGELAAAVGASGENAASVLRDLWRRMLEEET